MNNNLLTIRLVHEYFIWLLHKKLSLAEKNCFFHQPQRHNFVMQAVMRPKLFGIEIGTPNVKQSTHWAIMGHCESPKSSGHFSKNASKAPPLALWTVNKPRSLFIFNCAPAHLHKRWLSVCFPSVDHLYICFKRTIIQKHSYLKGKHLNNKQLITFWSETVTPHSDRIEK